MDVDFSKLLNKEQLEAVTTASQYVRIIAGAGSGKTRVLTYRIVHLIRDCNLSADDILAIAFTNKVAKEMKERTVSLLSNVEEGYSHLHIMTFHSFCARFLRQESRYIGYPPSFTIFDEDDQSRQVRAVGESKGYRKGDAMVKDALRYIRHKKGQGIYPYDISKAKVYGKEKQLLEFYEAYEERKTSCYALDFDDLLSMVIKILESNPEVHEYWSHRFKHILIDEFQDTNDVQMKLVSLLVNPTTSVYVVGDPDQTIYTWRGANQQIILDFNKNYKGAETIILNRNYRSTKPILEAANRLISHNKLRVPKDLYTEIESNEPVETKSCYTTEKEADWVANKVLEIVHKNKDAEGNYDYSKIALLYRSNYMSRPFEMAFAQKGIPYEVYGGHRFYERLEVKDILAYCTLMVNKYDNISFERVVNVPRRGFGEASIIILREEAIKNKLCQFEYVEALEKGTLKSELATKHVNTLIRFINLIKDTRARLEARDEQYSSIIQDFITKIGYLEYIAEHSEEDEDRVGNCKALFDDILNFQKSNPEASFAEYLQNITLLSSQDEIADGNHVSFMTAHTAKGLEFDYVFVVYLTDQAFPNQRALGDDDREGEEEERRLAYVAFTRARKKLYLTTNLAYSYTNNNQSCPSRYFKEAGLPVKNEYSYTRNSFARSSKALFDDGDHYDPFESATSNKKVVTGSTTADTTTKNQIVWKVGDILEHDSFGRGEVINKQGDDILIIKFEEHGQKLLLASHPKLHKVSSSGGKA